jgi:hypothetical protein
VEQTTHFAIEAPLYQSNDGTQWTSA